MQRYSGIVQSVEQRTVNPYVTSSSPVARATNIKGSSRNPFSFSFFYATYMLPKAGIFELLFSLYLRPNTSCRIIFYTVKISYYLGWEGGTTHNVFENINFNFFQKTATILDASIFFLYHLYRIQEIGFRAISSLEHSVRKHRNLMLSVFFAPLSSLTLMVGELLAIKYGLPESQRNH